jgi:S1-C subfamily serine protease
MRFLFLLLLNAINSLLFSQIKNEESDNKKVAGIYRILLMENYNDKGELFYSTLFEGEIIIKANGNILTANKIKTNKPYFSILRNGVIYKISDNSEISRQEGSFTADLFKSEEIKLKLSSTNKDHIGWYSIYTLHRITDKKELYNNIKQGTGFFIASDGYILTNNHVIAKSQITSIYIANKEYDCETIYSNEIDDIAIIRVKDTSLTFFPIPFSVKNFSVGDDVIAFGFPFASTMGKELKMSSGIVNSSKGFQDDARYFQFSAAIDPGNSGGPILNKSGNLVGLITAKYTSATNAGYALNLTNLIKNIPSVIKFTKETNSHTIPNSAIYSKYKNSIVLIKSYSL